MPKIVRALGYSGEIQTLSWIAPGLTPVTAYLWGGGGGSGGSDQGGGGGSGTGSGYAQLSFNLQPGDVIQVAVGQGGGTGQSQAASAAGGVAGAGLVSAPVFDTRSSAPPELVPVFNPSYGSFLNAYGVWLATSTAGTFDRTYTIDFPFSAEYTFTVSAKNRALITVDGTTSFFSDSSTFPFSQNVTLAAGNHTVRIQAETDSGAGAVALTIDSGISYSGARGGNAGGSGSNGGGGGGGGATVLLLNSTLIAVAAGGGGGGGSGRNGAGQNAPGPNGVGTVGQTAGENGQNKTAGGGGGGGGGGGNQGGNGGNVVSGDTGGEAGVNGVNLGSITANPNGVVPGGNDTLYYRGSVGRGGAAGGGTSFNGYAVFEFDLNGIYVRDNVAFQPVEKIWIKNQSVWTPVQGVYIKNNGVWQATLGSTSPSFVTVGQSKMGINPRLNSGQTGGGGGGSGQEAVVFDSRDAVGSVATTNSRWSPFMNSHAVWSVGGGYSYTFSGLFNFPYTGNYTFTYAVDDEVTISLDSSTIITYSGFRADPPASFNVFVTAGFHQVGWTAINSGGGPRGVALTVVQDFG